MSIEEIGGPTDSLPSTPNLSDIADEIDRLADQVRALIIVMDAARVLIATHPVFRLRRMGGEGSEARLTQESQILAEDALIAAIKQAESV